MKPKRHLRPRATDERQLALGLGSGERYKLFFAVMPPEPLALQVAALTRELRDEYGLLKTPRDPHVSIYGLGDYDDGVPNEVITAVQSVAPSIRVKPFDVIFDGIQVFAGKKEVLVLRCGKGLHGLVALQNAISNALAGAGADRPLFDSSFTPHLTLFYGGGMVPERSLDVPIAWRVDEFSLILSLQGHKHYEPYGTWKLRS